MAQFYLTKSKDYQIFNDTSGVMLDPSGKWMVQNLSNTSTVEFIIADALPAADQHGFQLRNTQKEFLGQFSNGANWYYRIVGSISRVRMISLPFTGAVSDPGGAPAAENSTKFTASHAVFGSPGALVSFIPARNMRVLVHYSATGYSQNPGRSMWLLNNQGVTIIEEVMNRLELYMNVVGSHSTLLPISAVYDLTAGVEAKFRFGSKTNLAVDYNDLSIITVIEL